MSDWHRTRSSPAGWSCYECGSFSSTLEGVCEIQKDCLKGSCLKGVGMSEFKDYRRKGFIEARPYVPGEAMGVDIAISSEDRRLFTLEGGMIARNPGNHADQWYISAEHFAKHYELDQ